MADIVEASWELNPEELQSGFTSDAFLLEPRSPGVHQSDIIRDLENIIIKPGQRKPDIEVSNEEMETLNRYRELGFLWEVVLEAAFKRRRGDNLDSAKFLRQVEIEQDGIFKTVDAIHIPDWRVLEFKLTFRSMNRASLDRFESEFWSWFTQLKGNCYGHETRLASLFVFWVNGTYHPPVPMTRRYDIVFGEQELVDNWRMLTTHRDVMQREGRLRCEKQSSSGRGRSAESPSPPGADSSGRSDQGPTGTPSKTTRRTRRTDADSEQGTMAGASALVSRLPGGR